MDNLQLFSYEGKEIRTQNKNGELWWVLKDVCDVLGIARPRDVATRLDSDEAVLTGVIDNAGREQKTYIINESGLYNVILRSDKPEAKPFRKWVTSEVLPSIRRTGGYTAQEALPAPVEPVTALNEMVKLLLPVFDRAGMAAPFQALAMKQIYRKAGIDLPVENLKAERELYDTGTIAKKAGVYALSGKPHVQAVGCILRNLEIPDSEKELVSFEKNGHMGTTYQYTAKVAELVKGWVKAQGFPEVIASDDGTRQFKVSYEN